MECVFTDLTGDGLPELCSTLTIGSGIADDRIIVYDYANGVSYSLEDRMKYDYSLSIQNGMLIVTKKVFNSSEVVEIGYPAIVDNTIQMIPFKMNTTELIPGTTYVSYRCIYMNPLSSLIAIGGDSGYQYIIGEDYFTMVNRSGDTNGNTSNHSDSDTKDYVVSNRIDIDRWEWREFPYTDEEWAALYKPGVSVMKNIRDLYNEIRYQPLTDMLFLLQVDGDLWLVELKDNPQMGTYLWSIFSLVPASTIGASQ